MTSQTAHATRVSGGEDRAVHEEALEARYQAELDEFEREIDREEELGIVTPVTARDLFPPDGDPIGWFMFGEHGCGGSDGWPFRHWTGWRDFLRACAYAVMGLVLLNAAVIVVLALFAALFALCFYLGPTPAPP